MGDNSLFVYGTLLHPKILSRVIHGPSNPTFDSSSTYVTTSPAMLLGYKRHRVRGADYPAIIPDAAEGACVRGTIASGLTDMDVRRLDIFEGSEYARHSVKVRRLGDFKQSPTSFKQPAASSNEPKQLDAASSEAVDLAVHAETGEELAKLEEVGAETYVWIAGEERLEKGEWDFETFKREKMQYWIGSDGTEGETGADEFEAVDRQADQLDGTGGRSLNGNIGQELKREYEKDIVESAV